MPPNTGSGDPRPRGLTVQKLDNLVRSKLIARTGSATNEQQVQRALYQALDRPGSARQAVRAAVLYHNLSSVDLMPNMTSMRKVSCDKVSGVPWW